MYICFTVIGIILISFLFMFFEILIGTTCNYTWGSCQSHLQTLTEFLQSMCFLVKNIQRDYKILNTEFSYRISYMPLTLIGDKTVDTMTF